MLKILWKMFFPNYEGTRFMTVRYAFPLVIVTTLVASIASVIPDSTSYVLIRTDATTVAKDQQFFIDVIAKAHVPVNAIDLTISYPENKMTIESIDTGTSVITLWTEKPYARDGNIYLRGGTFRQGFIGEHKIVRIKAHATESGEARILIKETQFVAGDGKGSIVPTTASDTYNEAKIFVSGSDGLIEAKASVSVVTDTNGDGDVDIADVATFMAAWLTKGSTYDFNGDGKMTFRDFSILLADSFFN